MDGPHTIGPPAAAAELALLVDTLMPGDELFPAASAVGVQALLAARLVRLRGASAMAELARAIADAGGPLGALNEPGRNAAVAKMERRYAALFDDVVKVVYLAYYESPIVQDAIRALGFTYHAHPLPGGYADQIGRYDPARDAPTHRRGNYTRTEEVHRVSFVDLGVSGETDAR
jgi:hypothetical protein